MNKIRVASTLFVVALGAAACASTGDIPQTAEGSVSEPIAATSGQDPRVERRLSNMQERLGLDDDQVALLRPVLESRHQRREEARESFHAELEGILTPEQLAELDEMHADRPGRRGRHGMRGRHGPPDPAHMLDRMTEHLELTDEQVTALTPIFEAAHARHEELRALPREERREAFRTIREETKAAVDAILSQEQRAKLEEHRGRRGGPGRGMGHHRRGGPHFEADPEAEGVPGEGAPIAE